MNLTPVDFKAVAAKGAYVYCYLREDDFTPYYVGVATRHTRPFDRHHCALPAYDALVRVLDEGMTREEACKREIFFIARYGRKKDGGILVNQNKGGEGNWGYEHTEKTIEHLRVACQEFGFELEQMSECAEALEAAGNCTFEQYTKMNYKDRQAFRKYLQRNPNGTYEMWANQSRSDYAKRGAMSRLAATAARVGASVDEWMELTSSHRTAVKAWLKRNPEKTFADWFMPRYRAA